MKKNNLLFAVLLLISAFLISCETKTDPTNPDGSDTTKSVTVVGHVVSSNGGRDLEGSQIIISDGEKVRATTTKANGKFIYKFELNEDRELTIIARSAGFFPDTTTTFGIINDTVTVPLFQLQRDKSVNGGDFSGKAASIYLYDQTDESVGVKESGSLESMQIIFEIMDSSGIVIGDKNPIEVSFRFGSAPGGGEYLYPNKMISNALGRVNVSLNTGTKAGVAQVIAEAVVDGKLIASRPVMIAIHGGFPDAGHFHVASKKFNYPKLGIVGFPIDFTAYIGDKYSNPVRENTSAYFNANSGIIQGSATTGNLGTATVTLLTQPFPNDPTFGKGFFRVTATTINEDNANIVTETIRLQSGFPIITFDPSTFSISNGGSEVINFTIADVNGNPMAEDQTVTVSAKSEFYDVAGAVEIKFPDTQSKAFTTFSFVIYDTRPDTTASENITITIESSGENGNTQRAIVGSGE